MGSEVQHDPPVPAAPAVMVLCWFCFESLVQTELSEYKEVNFAGTRRLLEGAGWL